MDILKETEVQSIVGHNVGDCGQGERVPGGEIIIIRHSSKSNFHLCICCHESACLVGGGDVKMTGMMQGGVGCLPFVHSFNKMPCMRSYASYWRYKDK